MGCTHSKSSKDHEHRRKLKIKEVLESSTQDPNNILRMEEPKPAPIIDDSALQDGPDGMIRLTKSSMKPRRRPASAHTIQYPTSTSSSGSTEEIWAKLHQPQMSSGNMESAANRIPQQAGAQFNASTIAFGAQQLPAETASSHSITSPHKSRRAAPPSRPAGSWKRPEMPSNLTAGFKPSSNRQTTRAASPSRPSQMLARPRRADLMFGPPKISFRKVSSQSASQKPMTPEQAFGMIEGPISQRASSGSSGLPVDAAAPVLHNTGNERIHGRWLRKAKPDSPIQDSISKRQVSSLSTSSGRVNSSGDSSVILDTQRIGSASADSTPRLMRDATTSPGSDIPQGVTVLGSPVKQPHTLVEKTLNTSFTLTLRASYESKR